MGPIAPFIGSANLVDTTHSLEAVKPPILRLKSRRLWVENTWHSKLVGRSKKTPKSTRFLARIPHMDDKHLKTPWMCGSWNECKVSFQQKNLPILCFLGEVQKVRKPGDFLEVFDTPNKLMAGTQKSTQIEKENQLPNLHFGLPY